MDRQTEFINYSTMSDILKVDWKIKQIKNDKSSFSQ